MADDPTDPTLPPQTRIADALERIADALELIVSDDFQLNVGLSDVDAAATEAIAQVFAAVFSG